MSSYSRSQVPYFADKVLYRRVDQENANETGFNVEIIVNDLIRKYKEYGRRNRSAFTKAVIKAHRIINDTLLMHNQMSDEEFAQLNEDGSEDSDQNSDEEFQPPAQYMNTIVSMVNQAPLPSSNELINISSDEEEPKSKVSKSSQKLKNVLKSSKYSGIKRLIKENLKDTLVKTTPTLKKRKSEPEPKKNKREPATIPPVSFINFGGYPKVIETVCDLVVHLHQYDDFVSLGVTPPRGFILHGPPGTGKTLLAQAIAGELKLPIIAINGTELVGSMSGESEQRIRDLFQAAKDQIPCIIFIDEIDAICQSRDTAKKDMERRIVSQLLASIDNLNACQEGSDLLVIGATNRVENIDPGLRRAGRFDKEVCIGIPDRKSREEILKIICNGVKLSPDVSIKTLAELTPGYVAADLKALTTEAAIAALKRCNKNHLINKIKPKENGNSSEDKEESRPNGDATETTPPADTNPKTTEDILLVKEDLVNLTDQEVSDMHIEMVDITKALKTVQPSSKREGFATVPDVTWDDIGSLREIREELHMSIMMPVKYPDEFAKMGVTSSSGMLLCGPPGCGKTLLAKAVANEANINFISVKGPELLNMYVGESERAVRQCFQRAKNSQPCVIFFDEIDALCPKRSDTTEGTVTSRIVNQVLTEMDGVESREGVFLMAATNRPDMVDQAVLRPGRLDKILYVGLPSAEDRVDILKALTKNGTNPPLGDDITLEDVGNSPDCDGYSGADLAALIKEASVFALTEYIKLAEANKQPLKENLAVFKRHFGHALKKIRPSVSAKEQLRYEELKVKYSQRSLSDEMEIN